VVGSELLCAVLGQTTSVSLGQNASQVDYLQKITEIEWQAAVEMAIRQRVEPLLYARLKKLAPAFVMPEDMERLLRERYHFQAMQAIQRQQQLGDMLALFDTVHVPVVVLKGAYLAEHMYQDISLRPMSDVDLLVQQADLERVSKILPQLGYSLQDSEWGAKHQIFLAGNGRFPLEIHWHILNQADPFVLEVEELWSRVNPVEISQQPVWTLSSEDLLLHLCLHASFSHGFRAGLRPFCDLDAVIAMFADKLDWDVIAQRGAEWGATRAVYLTLLLTNRLLKTAVPTQLLSIMQPADWNEELVEAALKNVFYETDLPYVSTNFARMWREKRPLKKAQIMWRSATLPSNMDRKGEGKQFETGESRNGRLRRYRDMGWRLVRRDEATRREILLKNWLGDG